MSGEHRRRGRSALRCEIFLWREGKSPVKARTENVSSTGFYCITEEPFSPGERVFCELLIPRYDRSAASSVILRRASTVVRLEIKGIEPGFGIACQFEDAPAL